MHGIRKHLIPGHLELVHDFGVISLFFQKINNFQQVGIFVVYLGTDASYIKMKVRFVISDLEDPRVRIFRKIENFRKKVETYPRNTV